MVDDLSVVILAAGQGLRMRSDLPKVLHTLGGKPMLSRVIETALSLTQDVQVVVGHAKEQLQRQIDLPVRWIEQAEQLGTAHAVKMALPYISDYKGKTLILYGDIPCIDTSNLTALVEKGNKESLVLLTDISDMPTGYGRIIRDLAGKIARIVEEKDASKEEKQIKEINTGIYLVPNPYLHLWLKNIKNHNAQGEYYLTDIIQLAYEAGVCIESVQVSHSYLTMGVNNSIQLAKLERLFQQQQAEQLMQKGLTLRDPSRFDLRGTICFGKDVVVDVNVVFEGKNVLGNQVTIGANCVLKDVTIRDGATIYPFSHLEDCVVNEDVKVGPYARLRPKATLARGSQVGNFVEIKSAQIGQKSKVNHLSYIGDTTVGENTNIGAGTVTCNYNGVTKYRTTIGADCFIGSGTMLVAPVTVGDGATVAAGSTITKSCPEKQLTIARSKQVSLSGWHRPKKEEK
ncbi:MAG: bifunctional UDP-N-acetylglucosamine diphosphorylase/glucosamine-1-phosphate N-acetyltransferase GlmU [Neisseriaceae bacterium]